ncbi:hypothetical protein [Nocardia sp. NPDC057668]|uniref:hypothetical protein n=1 Tax=Nocardia sp. NPDC057668 TaxID=3346202 RepID=UPI00366E3A42
MRNAAVQTRVRADHRRADLYCALGGALLVATAFLVPRILSEQWRNDLYAGAAPIFGSWLPHIGWGTGPAIGIAALVVAYGPNLARRLPWRRALLLTWVTSLAWAFALAMVDGWQRGFAGRLTTHDEYLHEVGGVTDIAAMLRGFSGRILDFQPDSWTTHVSGHPPGALLSFVLLDRAGLGGGAWAALLCMSVGCAAAVAVPVTIRTLGADAEQKARAALPFLALAPAAIWLAVSADALFAGVTAWAVALSAIATRQRRGWVVAACGAGALFGFALFLSYGMILMAVPAAAVLLARGLRPALPALVAALLVVALFNAAGFWWLDGYHLVVQRYYQGIASDRPYSYWVWANLAGTVCAIGLAPVAAAHRVVRGLRFGTLLRGPDTPGSAGRLVRWRDAVDPVALVAGAGFAALLLADLSGLSKAETERIWLPFEVWALAGAALLPARGVRGWLAVQAGGTLVLAHVILTNW